jgi:uncharacterized protein
MRLYFDTSALLKKYISEIGSENVDKLFLSATEIHISSIGQIEAISSFRKLLLEKEIENNDYDELKKEINQDFQFYNVIDITNEIILFSISTIDKYQLKSLDSIHLGTALSIKNDIDYFVSCDQKLLNAVKKEGFKVINPKE